MWMPRDWKDFEVVDAGGGMKLERWGPYYLLRPDPQALWPARGDSPAWKRIDATYHRSEKGGGSWEYHRKLPTRWEIRYGALAFEVGTLGFKHTGLFPEQAVNWRWMAEKIAQATARRGAEPFCLYRRGYSSLRIRRIAGRACRCRAGHGAVGAPIWRALVWPTARCASSSTTV